MEANDAIALPIGIKFKKLYPDVKLPYYGSEGAAGLDCTANSYKFDNYHNCHSYALGFAVEIPKGYVGLLFPRSSVYGTGLSMANCVGVIDSDYRGEVTAKFYEHNIGERYRVGDRCCQLIIIPYPKIQVIESDTLSDTVRGSGGYGSTGK